MGETETEKRLRIAAEIDQLESDLRRLLFVTSFFKFNPMRNRMDNLQVEVMCREKCKERGWRIRFDPRTDGCVELSVLEGNRSRLGVTANTREMVICLLARNIFSK